MPSRMHVSNIILIGLAIDESQIFIMRGDKPSHPLDLFGSSALIMLRFIWYDEYNSEINNIYGQI